MRFSSLDKLHLTWATVLRAIEAWLLKLGLDDGLDKEWGGREVKHDSRKVSRWR